MLGAGGAHFMNRSDRKWVDGSAVGPLVRSPTSLLMTRENQWPRGTIPDQSGVMNRSPYPTALLLLLGLSACSRDLPKASSDSNGDVDIAHMPGALQGDPIAAQADTLVRSGRPWRATTLLAPRLTAPQGASPELRLAGARAAAGWDGWTEVDRVLRGAPWLDTQFGAEGRELLARSALERGVDARADASLAMIHADDGASRAMRRVFLARAYDRANVPDSAAALYLSAATSIPRVADWLRLRAAGVTGDSAARAAIMGRVVSAPARARIASTDAQARERTGDFTGAALSFHRAGAEASAFRVQVLADRDDASRSALRRDIVAYLQKKPAAADALQAIDVLDGMRTTLSPPDELAVARAALGANNAARAASGFARAAVAGALAGPDRMAYASALARSGKAADAITVYASVADSALAPAAAYQRARLLVQMGDGASARGALRTVSQQYAGVRDAASPALLLLADLQVDDGDLAGAGQSLSSLVARYPGASQAALARFRLGLIQWESSPAAAATTFDSVAVLHPADEEATASRYWSARAYERSGRKADAVSRWQAIIKAAPLSYYAMRAAERLHVPGWASPGGADSVPHLAGVDSAVRRIVALRQLGMDIEARFEIDALVSRAGKAAADAPAVAEALVAAGEPSRGARVAMAAIEAGVASRAMYLVAYPVLHADALVTEASRNRLDPALVAGLIRQESSWNPRAVSPAAARGLMQLLPSVGASVAASHRYPLWNNALLFDPDVSIELGTAHLASSLRRDTPPERALAAYNAGASRVTRWSRRPSASEAELFTEWISFTETRDYVRLVLRNAAIYRALYGLKQSL